MNVARKPIVLCFGVLDEVSFIRYFVDHHLRAGIDALVGADLGSTDGTLEILERYEAQGRLHLLRYTGTQPFNEFAAPKWYEDLLGVARDAYDPAWCLFCDADELWMFPNEDAQAYFSTARSDIIRFPRCNVVPERDPVTGEVADVSEFGWVVTKPMHFTYNLQELQHPADAKASLDDYPPEILRSVVPKVAARTAVIGDIARGFHDVVPADAGATRADESTGYVAHYPMRSVQQIRSKAGNIARFIAENRKGWEQHPSPHWARWAMLLENNLIETEFQRQVLTPEQIAELAAAGVLIRDERLKRSLAYIRSR